MEAHKNERIPDHQISDLQQHFKAEHETADFFYGFAKWPSNEIRAPNFISKRHKVLIRQKGIFTMYERLTMSSIWFQLRLVVSQGRSEKMAFRSTFSEHTGQVSFFPTIVQPAFPTRDSSFQFCCQLHLILRLETYDASFSTIEKLLERQKFGHSLPSRKEQQQVLLFYEFLASCNRKSPLMQNVWKRCLQES